jgi:hypothetical protein
LKLQDDGDGALKEYNIASGIAGDMAGRDPEDVAWKRYLEQSYVKIGEFSCCPKGTREALEHYQSAIKLVENVAAQYPQITALSALAERLNEKTRSLMP